MRNDLETLIVSFDDMVKTLASDDKGVAFQSVVGFAGVLNDCLNTNGITHNRLELVTVPNDPDLDHLHETTQAVYCVIARSKVPPSIREIGAALGIGSTSVIAYHINKLIEAGLIERKAKKARGLQVREAQTS